MSLSQEPCLHQSLTYKTSPFAKEAKYKHPSEKTRLQASRPSPSSNIISPRTRTDLENFPAPLTLPDDDLSCDQEDRDLPQSFQEWYDEEERNPVTSKQKTVYVVGPPGVDEGIEQVLSWTEPQFKNRELTGNAPEAPAMADVLEYLKAFYHGLPVKELQMPKKSWNFTPWTEETSVPPKKPKQSKKTASPIGLSTKAETIRIRARPSPDKIYTTQLNLDDLLDVAISILPKDAYALCMIVSHDLYEDDDDTFVCGRAYGGSRVAVVSMARYSPLLDGVAGIDRVHSWPGSQCKRYVENVCEEYGVRMPKRAKVSRKSSEEPGNGPLEAAVDAFRQPEWKLDGEDLSALWLWRIIRTASHELGHCFGIDHCVYYACIMQGSASLSEDARQPPYLCPVDSAKVFCATGSTVENRDRALLRYCEGEGRKNDRNFRAFAAWLRSSLAFEESDSKVIILDD